jgi:hypothetical protein
MRKSHGAGDGREGTHLLESTRLPMSYMPSSPVTDHHHGDNRLAEGYVQLCKVPTEREFAQGTVTSEQSEVQLEGDELKEQGAHRKAEPSGGS